MWYKGEGRRDTYKSEGWGWIGWDMGGDKKCHALGTDATTTVTPAQNADASNEPASQPANMHVRYNNRTDKNK